MIADSNDYTYWCNNNSKTKFQLPNSIDILPLTLSNIILKKHNDRIAFNRQKTSINNLLMGTIYIDNHGKMEFKNYTTGDTGNFLLILKNNIF